MNVDGGANVHICTNKDLFYFYKSIKCGVQQVGGSTLQADGIGLMFIRIKTSDVIIPIYPVYHIPNNPQHTLSPPAIKHYNGYKRLMFLY